MQENIDEERGECEHGIALSEEENLNNRIYQQGNSWIRDRNIRQSNSSYIYFGK